MADSELLVGDIGGTNARFAISRPDGSLRDIARLRVREHVAFDDALAAYLDGLEGVRPSTMCIASAGARHGDTITLTNAPWQLGETALTGRFGFQAVRLINDFQAQARFAGTMPEEATMLLKSGTPVEGAPVLTVGPGTGFGQALFVPGRPPHVVATEGGHRLMPVRSDAELRLYRRLEERLGHQPIVEEVLSGRGISNLFEAVVLEAGRTPEPAEPPAVTEAGLKGDGAARDAIVWFMDILAAVCADACVCTGARGGIAISGGIVPRFTALLPEIDFPARFAREGILKNYLSEVPVRLVTDNDAALRGTALLMRDMLQGAEAI